MANFQIGETVICSVEVKNSAGTLVDPSTSMKINIRNPQSVLLVTDTTMTKDSVGKYHYDFQTSDDIKGTHYIEYKATDGTRITIERETFVLE